MELKSKRAFLVIEVIISILITFLAIVTIVTAYKYKNLFNNKDKLYQNLYITVKSTISWLDKEKIDINSLNYVLYKTFNLNNFNVKVFIKKIQSKRNYVVRAPGEGPSGNIGNLNYTLYEVKMIFQKNSFIKKYLIYLTKVKKLS